MASKRGLPWLTAPLGYAFAQSFGRKLGPWFQELEARGDIVVTGREAAIEAVSHGNCVIAANHPSVIDDFPTAAIFYPYYLYEDRFFLWSMPDRPILKSFHIPLWAAPLFRCIVVDRTDDEVTKRGFRLAIKVLRAGYTIAVHVEGGRTDGQANQGKPPYVLNERRIREVGTGIFQMSVTKPIIIPLYISMPHIEEVGQTRGRDSVTIPLARMNGKAGKEYLPVGFHFGEPYQLPEFFNRKDPVALAAAQADLRERILHA